MALARVQIYNDELKSYATVPESAVKHLKDKGWRLVEPEPEAETEQGEPRTVKPSRPATLGRPAESASESTDEAASTGEPKPRKKEAS